MNLNISYDWLFADSLTLVIVLIFAILFLMVLVVFSYIMIVGLKRPGKIKMAAEKNGLTYEKSAKSNVYDMGLFGQKFEAYIRNYCKGIYRGKNIEFYDLMHSSDGLLRVLGETIIKVDNNIIWPQDYSDNIRDITKGLTNPDDIFGIIDAYIDKK